MRDWNKKEELIIGKMLDVANTINNEGGKSIDLLSDDYAEKDEIALARAKP